MHSGNETLIDYNRSDVPLVEIVTEPDFTDTAQIKDYAKKLQQIFRYLGVSNADMEHGDMRLEANISVRPVGQKELPNYRVELKNINSFRFMAQAVEYEIKRQTESLEKGEKLVQETRGWDEDKRQTYVQRTKEEAHDYRYFPEPDLPEMRLQNLELKAKQETPELPHEKMKRFVQQYQISKANASILTENKNLANFFEDAVTIGKDKDVTESQVANYIVNQKVDFQKTTPLALIEVILSKKLGIIEDEETLTKLAKETIEESPQFVLAYKAGKTTILQAFIGNVMRKTGGKADTSKLRQILEKLLSE